MDETRTQTRDLLGGELAAKRHALESEKRALEARLRELDELDHEIAKELERRGVSHG